jgi:hypothetical protein
MASASSPSRPSISSYGCAQTPVSCYYDEELTGSLEDTLDHFRLPFDFQSTVILGHFSGEETSNNFPSKFKGTSLVLDHIHGSIGLPRDLGILARATNNMWIKFLLLPTETTAAICSPPVKSKKPSKKSKISYILYFQSLSHTQLEGTPLTAQSKIKIARMPWITSYSTLVAKIQGHLEDLSLPTDIPNEIMTPQRFYEEAITAPTLQSVFRIFHEQQSKLASWKQQLDASHQTPLSP